MRFGPASLGLCILAFVTGNSATRPVTPLFVISLVILILLAGVGAATIDGGRSE